MENNELFEIAKSVFPQKAVFTAKVFKSEFAHKLVFEINEDNFTVPNYIKEAIKWVVK